MSVVVRPESLESRNATLARICFWVAATLSVFGTICYLGHLVGLPSLGMSYLGWLAIPYGIGYLVSRRRR